MESIYVLIPLIIAFAFFGEAIFGFGGGLISIPLVSLLIGVKDAVTLVLIFQALMGVLIWKCYRHIEWKRAKPMTYGLIFGTVAGTLLLSQASTLFLELFLAGSILLFLIKSIWFSGFTASRKKGDVSAVNAGLGGGLFQGLIGMGGPVLTMYLSVAVTSKQAIRATLIYLFFVGSLIRLGISIPEQLFSNEVLRLASVSLPVFIIVIFIGQNIHHKVSDGYYKLAINIILATSAFILISRTLF